MDMKTPKTIRRAIRLDRTVEPPGDSWLGGKREGTDEADGDPVAGPRGGGPVGAEGDATSRGAPGDGSPPS